MSKLNKLWLIALISLMLVANSDVVLGQGSSVPTDQQKASFLVKVLMIVCISFGGILGGFIFSISKKRRLDFPQRYTFISEQESINGYNLGFIGDILIGLGGGILIFLVVPFGADETLLSNADKAVESGDEVSFFLEVLATAMVGGFAGISLFDEAAKRLNQQVSQLEFDLNAKSQELNSITVERSKEANVQFLLNRYLDPSLSSLSIEEKRNLLKLISSASINTRNWVFEKLQEAISSSWIMRQKVEVHELNVRVATLEQIIPLLEALQAGAKDGDSNTHRYLAHMGLVQEQLATANQEKGKKVAADVYWNKALQSLEQAITARNEIGDPGNRFWHYNLHQLLCLHMLNLSGQAKQKLDEIKPVWKQMESEPSVVISLLQKLDKSFLGWIKEQDASLVKLISVENQDIVSEQPRPQRDDDSEVPMENPRSTEPTNGRARNHHHPISVGVLTTPDDMH